MGENELVIIGGGSKIVFTFRAQWDLQANFIEKSSNEAKGTSSKQFSWPITQKSIE